MTFFGEMKKFNAELGTMVNCEYAECYWQHLGGGFQKDPLLQQELSDRIKHRRSRMNTNTEKYTRFALCREMMETPEVIRNFNPDAVEKLAVLGRDSSMCFFTGEGSSRIFPTKRARASALRESGRILPITEGATQSLEYDLSQAAVFGASNSGRTRELVRLFTGLRKQGHQKLGAVIANTGNTAGRRLPMQLWFSAAESRKPWPPPRVWWSRPSYGSRSVPFSITAVSPTSTSAQTPWPKPLAPAYRRSLPDALAGARTIFFAGRNDGVAEELTLKTNEIVRKRSDFLEGTYAAHGIEEVMSAEDVVILVDPLPPRSRN